MRVYKAGWHRFFAILLAVLPAEHSHYPREGHAVCGISGSRGVGNLDRGELSGSSLPLPAHHRPNQHGSFFSHPLHEGVDEGH